MHLSTVFTLAVASMMSFAKGAAVPPFSDISLASSAHLDVAAKAPVPDPTVSTVTHVFERQNHGDGNYELNEIESDAFVSSSEQAVVIPLIPDIVALHLYYDPDNREIGSYVTVLGTQIGPKYSAGLDTGIQIQLNLLVVKGSIRVFYENGWIIVESTLESFGTHYGLRASALKIF